MSTTAKDIIMGALGRRDANDPGKLAGKKELIRVLSRRIRKIYADVAEASPFFFADSEEVTPTDLGWPQPATSIVVFHIETLPGTAHITVPDIPAVLVLFGFPADQLYDIDDPPTPMDSVFKVCKWLEGGPGTEAYLRANMGADYGITDDQLDAVLSAPEPGGREVAMLPFLDRHADEGIPRVYQLGKYFRSVGETGDPVEGAESGGGQALEFFYSRRHVELDPDSDWDTEANTLEDDWPEHRNKLLEAEIAYFLAKKDGRTNDFQPLRDEISEEMAELLQEARLKNEYNRSRRWSDRPRLA